MPGVYPWNHFKFERSTADNMTILSIRDQALFETAKRVLAQIINEGLVSAQLEQSTTKESQTLCLQSILNPQDGRLIKVALKIGTIIEIRDGLVVSVVRPDSLQPPVTIAATGCGESDPGTLFKLLSTSFRDITSDTVLDEMVNELRNSAANQGKVTLIPRHARH